MVDLQENLQQVEANICKACENAGRKRSDVTLIAVSKTKPIEMLQTVYDLGPRDFGENKVQEMCEKMEVLPKDIRWHMIDEQSEIYHWKDRTHPFGGQSSSGKRNRKTGGKTKRNRLDSCRGQYCRRGE